MGSGVSFLRNDTLSAKFSPGSLIGKGGFASIFLTTYVPEKLTLASKEINIKKVFERSNGLDSLRNELEALRIVSNHQYITNLHFAYTDRTTCYLILDLCTGGDLRFHVGRVHNFSEKEIAFIAACIGSALHHTHACGVIHRDVKPENIIFDCHGVPRLTDFGVAYTCKNAYDIVCSSSSGTMRYLAPEVLTPNHFHSFESDFWSLGAVVVELISLQRAFKKHCPREMVEYSKQEYKFLWESLDRRCQQYSLSDANMVLYSATEDDDDVDKSHQFLTAQELVQDFHIENSCSPRDGDGDGKDRLPAYLSSFQVKPPCRSAYGINMSEECQDFVRNLLDVRITHRLGVGQTNYKRFAGHHFFACNGIDFDSLDGGRGVLSIIDNHQPSALATSTGPSKSPITDSTAQSVTFGLGASGSDVKGTSLVLSYAAQRSPFLLMVGDERVFQEVQRRMDMAVVQDDTLRPGSGRFTVGLTGINVETPQLLLTNMRSGRGLVHPLEEGPLTATKVSPSLNPENITEELRNILDNYEFVHPVHQRFLEEKQVRLKHRWGPLAVVCGGGQDVVEQKSIEPGDVEGEMNVQPFKARSHQGSRGRIRMKKVGSLTGTSLDYSVTLSGKHNGSRHIAIR
jgi:serine/threonine protein kinase